MVSVEMPRRRMTAWLAALIPAIVLASSARGQEPSGTALPSPESLVAKYVEAIGGKDAHTKATSRHSVGTFAVPAQNATGKLEVFSAAPNKQLVHISLPQIGDIRSGFDGETGWMMHPMMGNQLADGARLEDMKANAEFLEFARYEKHTASMETIEETDFEGKPCYKVKIVDKAGDESFEYFEKDTGLLRGTSGKRQAPTGPVDVINVNTEWMEVGGMKFPSKSVQRIMGIEQIVTIEKIELDNVDPAVFALPEEIKKIKSGEATPTPPTRPPGLEP